MRSAEETAALLPYAALVGALRTAALEVAAGDIQCPQRQVLPMGQGGAVLSMLAVAADLTVHKLVTVVPDNAARGRPTVQGHVSVSSSVSGEPLLMLDGATVTGARTAALSMLGVATLLGAAPRAVRIYGTGAQAHHHVLALAALYPGSRIEVAGRGAEAAGRFCAAHARPGTAMRPAPPAPPEGDVDLVITCTTSPEPVYREGARARRLVVAVGAYTPQAAEVAAATVRDSALYVDDLLNARAEAGDLLRAGVDWQQVQSIAQAIGAPPPAGAVLFKTVGSAAWDLAAARVAVEASGCHESVMERR
ncbi:MAG TPA: delta(1)-pyrroline-2-carboxylate reductase family protein [Burkholderiaceae bacterium]|nr:delta(1)-pyrroline-2-carboxylate reductase family protein [Burkholderiaceae bacterium]